MKTSRSLDANVNTNGSEIKTSSSQQANVTVSGQAQKVVGAATELGRRLTNAQAYSGSSEETVLLEEPEALNAVLWQDEEVGAKMEAETARPGLTIVRIMGVRR